MADADIETAASLISGTAKCRLPIVYVSAGFYGDHILDSDLLAVELAGMAHVVVEPNRHFSVRLRLEVNSVNVYGGTIGIYWPDGAGRRSFFIGREFESADEIARTVIDKVRSALANRRSLDRCAWATIQEGVSRQASEALKASGVQEVGKYVEQFDKELSAKDQRLAEKEILRLRNEVSIYESRLNTSAGISVRTGDEQDLYPNEMAGFIWEAIEDALTRVLDDKQTKTRSSSGS